MSPALPKIEPASSSAATPPPASKKTDQSQSSFDDELNRARRTDDQKEQVAKAKGSSKPKEVKAPVPQPAKRTVASQGRAAKAPTSAPADKTAAALPAESDETPQSSEEKPGEQSKGKQREQDQSQSGATSTVIPVATAPDTAAPAATAIPAGSKQATETTGNKREPSVGRTAVRPVDANPDNSSATATQAADETSAADPAATTTDGEVPSEQKARGNPSAAKSASTLGKPAITARAKGSASQAPPSEAESADVSASAAAQTASLPASDVPADTGALAPVPDAPTTISASRPVAAPTEPGALASAPPARISGTSQTVSVDKPAPASPEVQFAEVNHPKLVTAIHGQLLPNGGSMQLRLDPPELGALHVTVRMQDGLMSAAFETSNDQATKLLSHSLGDLKTVLESQGVSVEKLQVRQTRQEQPGQGSSEERRQGSGAQDPDARREQQRRELLQRMWRRLNGSGDPLDMVA